MLTHPALTWQHGGVWLWWLILCSIAAVNILAWSYTAALLRRRRAACPRTRTPPVACSCTEVAWMSLYFSVAVWISISLIHAALQGARRHRESSDEGRAIRGPASFSA